MAESAVLVMKRGNACGAKGWQLKGAEEGNDDCTQQWQNDKVNET